MLHPEQPLKHRLYTRDFLSLLALSLLFAASLFGSWQRWTQPLIDHGREMNLPARILAGEQLYADVQFLYGPFAPYFNALLYRVFGIHLSVLKMSGAIAGILILLAVYWLSRRLMSVWESAVTTGLVLVTCALKSTGNYIQPYAYAALYGLVFAIWSLANIVRFIELRSEFRLQAERNGSKSLPEGGATNIVFAGALAGLAVITKPETALSALCAAGAAIVIESITARRLLWRETLLFAFPVIAIPAATYGFILSRVPLRVLLKDNHVLFTNMPPQLVYFNRYVSGLDDWPRSLCFTLAGLGVFAMWVGICALVGALVSMKKQNGWKHAIIPAVVTLIIGALWYKLAAYFFRTPKHVTPLASAAIVLPIVIGVVGWRIWKSGARVSFAPRALLILSVFSLLSILRAILNVTTTGPYTPFFIPVLIIVYLYLLFRIVPVLLAKNDSILLNAQRVTICLMGALVIGMAVNSAKRLRGDITFTVATPRGSFVTPREFGVPLDAALRYVQQQTGPDDYVLALPQATTINFLSARHYPLREEIVHPGFLDGKEEDRAIEHLKSLRVPLILIANLDTSEFRDRFFGLDYNIKLMDWIKQNYHVTARFHEPSRSGANFSREPFFITAYERN